MELFSPGCLGTCWYGKYHYLEPFVGCGFDCLYCYARSREQVAGAVKAKESSFGRPQLALPKPELLAAIKKTAASGEISILKLCRFTDILCEPFASDGTSLEILRALAQSPIKRIIITTKGAAGPDIIALMKAHPSKFSYNVVLKPRGEFRLEQGPDIFERKLEAAAQAQAAGALVTVHMDPLLAGVEDGEAELAQFFATLSKAGLKRVMFSYLLVNEAIAALVRGKLAPAQAEKLLSLYEGPQTQILPSQKDTAYSGLKPEVKTESVRRVSRLLTERGFDFVLCSLKSGKDGVKKGTGCPLCDGKFYA